MKQRSTYERIGARLLSLPCLPERPSCAFIGGRLLVGSKSTHRYANARKWRCFWRIKANRAKAEAVCGVGGVG